MTEQRDHFPTPTCYCLARRIGGAIDWAIDEYDITSAEVVAALAPFLKEYAIEAAIEDTQEYEDE